MKRILLWIVTCFKESEVMAFDVNEVIFFPLYVNGTTRLSLVLPSSEIPTIVASDDVSSNVKHPRSESSPDVSASGGTTGMVGSSIVVGEVFFNTTFRSLTNDLVKRMAPLLLRWKLVS